MSSVLLKIALVAHARTSPRHREPPPGHHPPEAGERLASCAGDELVRVGPVPIQAEQIGHAHKFVMVVLLDKAVPVQAEHPDIPVRQRVLVAEGDGPVGEVGLHGVPLDSNSENRPLGVLRLEGVVVEVGAENRRGVPGGGRDTVEGDDLRRLLGGRSGLLQEAGFVLAAGDLIVRHIPDLFPARRPAFHHNPELTALPHSNRVRFFLLLFQEKNQTIHLGLHPEFEKARRAYLHPAETGQLPNLLLFAVASPILPQLLFV